MALVEIEVAWGHIAAAIAKRVIDDLRGFVSSKPIKLHCETTSLDLHTVSRTMSLSSALLCDLVDGYYSSSLWPYVTICVIYFYLNQISDSPFEYSYN